MESQRAKEMSVSSKVIIDVNHIVETAGSPLLVLKTKPATLAKIKTQLDARLAQPLRQSYFDGYVEGDEAHQGKKLYVDLESAGDRLDLYMHLNEVTYLMMQGDVTKWEPRANEMIPLMDRLVEKGVKVARQAILTEAVTRLFKWAAAEKDFCYAVSVLASDENSLYGIQACFMDEGPRALLQDKLVGKLAQEILSQPHRDTDALEFSNAFVEVLPRFHAIVMFRSVRGS